MTTESPEDDEGELNWVAMRDVWSIPYISSSGRERVGYPTQKPLALLDRIINASSKPGDMVLDPFCGSATTCVAAENLGREWIGIDLSPKTGELITQRLVTGYSAIQGDDIVLRGDLPQRTDLGPLPRASSAEVMNQIYRQQAARCAHCRSRFDLRDLEVGHIIARSKGGTDHLSNVQLLCANCNRAKGDRGLEYLRDKLQLAA